MFSTFFRVAKKPYLTDNKNMGFTVSNYSFLGLQQQNWYVTIKGSYQVKKIESLIPGNNSAGLNLPGIITPYYTITFSVYFKASPNSQVINDQYMSFNIQALPNPAVLYKIIYDYVKGQLDPYYMSNQQTLTFTDDITESTTIPTTEPVIIPTTEPVMIPTIIPTTEQVVE